MHRTPSLPRRSLPGDFEDPLDFDRRSGRQGPCAHRGTRVIALFAEYLRHYIGRTVDDLRLPGEIGIAVDKSGQTHAADHVVEITAARDFEMRKEVQGA